MLEIRNSILGDDYCRLTEPNSVQFGPLNSQNDSSEEAQKNRAEPNGSIAITQVCIVRLR